MKSIDINKCKYYYEIHGNGEPLVLIAGLKGDHANWIPILDELTQRFKVLIFDNRAVGRTADGYEHFTIETMADDIMMLSNALSFKSPHILGHSMGGAIAQTIAKNYPNEISSIILSNTFIKFNACGKKLFNEVLKLHESNASYADIMQFIAPYVFSKTFLNQKLLELIRKSANKNLYPQSLLNYKRQLLALYEFDSSNWINEIKVPALVIGSSEDTISTSHESYNLAKLLSNAKLIIMKTSHANFVEKPIEFIKNICDFVKCEI